MIWPLDNGDIETTDETGKKTIIPGKGGIIFLDEINRAHPAVQAAMPPVQVPNPLVQRQDRIEEMLGCMPSVMHDVHHSVSGLEDKTDQLLELLKSLAPVVEETNLVVKGSDENLKDLSKSNNFSKIFMRFFAKNLDGQGKIWDFYYIVWQFLKFFFRKFSLK